MFKIGNVEINGGTIKSTNGINNNGTGNVIMNGGVIEAYLGITNSSTGNIIINDGKIISNSNSISYDEYGICNNNSGKVIILGGEISCNVESRYAIINNAKGSIIIGTDDGKRLQPVLEGTL